MATRAEPSAADAHDLLDFVAALAVNPFVISATALAWIAAALLMKSSVAVVAGAALLTGWASAWSP